MNICKTCRGTGFIMGMTNPRSNCQPEGGERAECIECDKISSHSREGRCGGCMIQIEKDEAKIKNSFNAKIVNINSISKKIIDIAKEYQAFIDEQAAEIKKLENFEEYSYYVDGEILWCRLPMKYSKWVDAEKPV